MTHHYLVRSTRGARVGSIVVGHPARLAPASTHPTHYDNLDQVTRVERYLENYPSADILIARSETFYDDRGRVYETRTYAVDPSTGQVGNYLAGYTTHTDRKRPAG